jgi:ABC-type dipeptide/oligopeptide/nickel transport system permease component
VSSCRSEGRSLRLITYIARRLLLLLPVLIGISLLVFAITMLFSPRQRADLYVRNSPPAPWDEETWGKIIKKYNLNGSWESQYFGWMNEILHGNLGWSFTVQQPVLSAISERFPVTFEIVLISAPVIVLLGSWMGIQAAVHKDTAIDHLARTFATLGGAAPSFWVAILLLSVFYVRLGWLPRVGRLSFSTEIFVSSGSFVRYTRLNVIDGLLNGQLWVTADALWHLLLPVTVVIFTNMALIVRVMRASMLEALSKNYIITAKAKGLSERAIVNTHARRNALTSTVTISGLLVSSLVTGFVIIETVFSIGGLGLLAIQSTHWIDVPTLTGLALFAAIVIVLTNLIVDILYAYIDPRIRYR